VTVLGGPTLRAIGLAVRRGEQYDIIFLDPPYGAPKVLLSTLKRLGEEQGIVAQCGLVVAQYHVKLALPDAVGNLQVVNARQFGDTALRFYRREKS